MSIETPTNYNNKNRIESFTSESGLSDSFYVNNNENTLIVSEDKHANPAENDTNAVGSHVNPAENHVQVAEKAHKKKIRIGWLIFSILMLGLAAGLMYIRKEVSWFAPFYSTHIYPIWQGTLGRLSGTMSFSLSEAILYSLPVIFILDIAWIVISKKRRIGGMIKRIIVLASLLAFLYAANCGVNYYNDSFILAEKIPVYQLNYDDKNAEALLIDFCEFAAAGLQESSREAATIPYEHNNEMGYGCIDKDGYLEEEKYYPDKNGIATFAIIAMEQLGEKYPSLSGYYPAPKPLFNPRPFSNMGITGIYSPFTIEANYNSEMTAYNIPFTACHELSHLKGYMDEGEANFIGWLACMDSSHWAFKRSAYMMAWVFAGNELNDVNSKEFSRIRKSLPKDVLEELHNNNVFWDTYETKASEVQDQINDAYLQYNGLELGIRSYDQVVTLMLSWYYSTYHSS